MATRRHTAAAGAAAGRSQTQSDDVAVGSSTDAAGRGVGVTPRRTAPRVPHARLRVATLNTRFVLDKYRRGRLRLLKDTIHGMLHGGKRFVGDEAAGPGSAQREWPVVMGLQEACVSPGLGVTCLPASVPQPRRTRCLPSCCCCCVPLWCCGTRLRPRSATPRHAVHTLPHVLAYARQFRLLRWLLSLFFVQWLLDAFALFNEWLLERIIGGWGQAVFYHPIGKYLYMLLGSAFVFGNAIVTHVPGGMRTSPASDVPAPGGAQAPVASPHVVGHHELTVGDFRAIHAVTLRLPCEPPMAAGRGADPDTGSAAPATAAGELGTVSVVVCNVHLSSAVKDVALRAEQAKALVRWLNEDVARDADAVFVVGDYNAPPAEPTHDILRAGGYVSLYAAHHGKEPAVTFPTGIQAVTMDVDDPNTLDFVYVRSRGQTVAASVDLWAHLPAPGDPTLYPSDHMGLVADVFITPSKA